MAKKEFAVFGLGEFGSSIAIALEENGCQVLAVDSNQEKVQEISAYVTHAACANVADQAVVRSLGIHNMDGVIVGIGENLESSIMATICAKECGVPYVLAKAVDDLHAKVLRKVGADRVVFPERDMGARVAKSLVTPSILDMMELADDYQIAEVRTPASWCGHTLVEVNVRRNYGLSVLAIHRGKEFLASPGADTMLREGDVLLVLGKQASIDSIEQK